MRSYFKQNPGSPDETYLFLKQMIPSIDKRVFNVKDKQVKLMPIIIFLYFSGVKPFYGIV